MSKIDEMRTELQGQLMSLQKQMSILEDYEKFGEVCKPEGDMETHTWLPFTKELPENIPLEVSKQKKSPKNLSAQFWEARTCTSCGVEQYRILFSQDIDIHDPLENIRGGVDE